MTEVSGLNFKNNSVDSVTFKGDTITALNFNDLQWIPSPTPVEFILSPLLMDSSGRIDTEFGRFTIGTTGNSLSLCKVTGGVNINNITVTSSTPSSTHFLVNKIDNWGFLLIKKGIWDNWPGGESGQTWNENITFSYSSYNYIGKFALTYDENNTEFLNGLFVNKTFRIPSSGLYEGILTYQVFPYSFDSSYFGMTGFDLMYCDWSIDEATAIDPNDLSNTIFTTLSQEVNGLIVTLRFSIGTNPTNNYRTGILYSKYYTMISFLQEPYSNKRIYFGKVHYDYHYKTNDLVTGSSNRNEYLFHQLESCDLGNSYDVTNSSNYTLLYPSNLSDTYDMIIEGGTPTEDTETYTWDGIVYKRLSCSSSITIKFRKK